MWDIHWHHFAGTFGRCGVDSLVEQCDMFPLFTDPRGLQRNVTCIRAYSDGGLYGWGLATCAYMPSTSSTSGSLNVPISCYRQLNLQLNARLRLFCPWQKSRLFSSVQEVAGCRFQGRFIGSVFSLCSWRNVDTRMFQNTLVPEDQVLP